MLEQKKQEEKQQKAEEKQLRRRIWEETRAQLDAEKQNETESEGMYEDCLQIGGLHRYGTCYLCVCVCVCTCIYSF